MSAEDLEPLWQPSAPRAASSRLADLTAVLARRSRESVTSFADAHRLSVEQPDLFWSAVWDDCGVLAEKRGEEAFVPGTSLREARWFPDARLNFAENLLRRRDDGPAMVFRGEVGGSTVISWAELHALVSRLQQALRAAGVGPLDRVAAWMPNIPETYAVMLASASIGAVFSSSSPDFGVDGVVDRFGQIRPKVLFAADAYRYGGRVYDCLDRLGAMVERLPSVETTVVVPFVDADVNVATPGGKRLSSFLEPFAPERLEFEQLPFDHPLYVLYSSGTTGAPKSIVHRGGGILLKHLVEHQYHCDVRSGDRVFYFTTAGWMMWNWLASALASNATLVLYDGNPVHPDPSRLFDLAADSDVTLFGTSAKFIEAVRNTGLRPADTHDLAALRTITSTGSPLSPEGFEYVYDAIHPDVHLASISGGTDLCGCLVAGDPTGPVWPGEIQRPGLGMAIDVVDEAGESLPPGERGELVCRSPFPSMPLGFWDDDDGSRYAAAYFERYEGMWHQGDYASWTDHGGIVIHGRSDATLNPGGVRIGTAEIYRQVEPFEEILESVVIGQRHGDDVRVVLFVRLADGVELTDGLVERIRGAIRDGASPRHVPAVVAAVEDIPRTRSGKISELAVRDVVEGRDVANTEALANPEALELFRDVPELR